MTDCEIDRSQQQAAKVAGAAYLFAMAASIFTEFVIGRRLVVPGDASATARNILAHETLFRVAVTSFLLVLAANVALIAALHTVLKRVHGSLALLATFLRLVESALTAAAILNYIDVLLILGPDFSLRVFKAEELHALARLSIASYGAGLGIAFFYLGCGSTIFAYLWRRSRYIPRVLADLGIFASPILSLGALAYVLAPRFWARVFPLYMAPMFFFEVGIGIWLLVKPLRLTK